MSHKANDIVADNRLDELNDTEDTSEEAFEQEVEAQDREENRYDDSHEPTCGGGSEKEY